MVDPASGPFLFDTSAESWLARADDLGAKVISAVNQATPGSYAEVEIPFQ